MGVAGECLRLSRLVSRLEASQSTFFASRGLQVQAWPGGWIGSPSDGKLLRDDPLAKPLIRIE